MWFGNFILLNFFLCICIKSEMSWKSFKISCFFRGNRVFALCHVHADPRAESSGVQGPRADGFVAPSLSSLKVGSLKSGLSFNRWRAVSRRNSASKDPQQVERMD